MLIEFARRGERNLTLTNLVKSHPRLVIPAGFIAGLIGGAIARAWMRWVSTDPEFTWSGSLYIVIAFAIFGAVQAMVSLIRSKPRKRWVVILARSLGVIFTLPLFMAAGSSMFPTVLFLSLSLWRKSWINLIRIFLAAIGIIIWLLIINSEIVHDFGWNIVTIGRIGLFGLIYTVIIWALNFTVRPLEKNPK